MLLFFWTSLPDQRLVKTDLEATEFNGADLGMTGHVGGSVHSLYAAAAIRNYSDLNCGRKNMKKMSYHMR